jgi:hypothetical protein
MTAEEKRNLIRLHTLRSQQQRNEERRKEALKAETTTDENGKPVEPRVRVRKRAYKLW